MSVDFNSDELLRKAVAVRMLLTDCDGVLTDGGVYYSDDGEQLKRFNIRDGMGVERLRNIVGVETGIVTGEQSLCVQRRADKLKISECHLGSKDKAAVITRIAERLKLDRQAIAYIGDDTNDLPVFPLVGLTACPQDAMDEVRATADFICLRCGGQGAFREFAEFIIQTGQME